ncbi:unnamed protein product, partial [marine sediment metagenome]
KMIHPKPCSGISVPRDWMLRAILCGQKTASG